MLGSILVLFFLIHAATSAPSPLRPSLPNTIDELDIRSLFARDDEVKVSWTINLTVNPFHQSIYEGTDTVENFWATQGLSRTNLRFSVHDKLDATKKKLLHRREDPPKTPLPADAAKAAGSVEDHRSPTDILLEKAHEKQKEGAILAENPEVVANAPLDQKPTDTKHYDGGRIDHDWDVYVMPVENVLADNEFLIRVGVGTPEQNFWTAVDSGSSDFWVFSGACCFLSNHSSFDPKKSSTFQNRTLDWNGTAVFADKGSKGQLLDISYGESSSLDTYLAFDTVTINTEKEPLPIANQTISLVIGAHGAARQSRKNEALLGIGPSASSAAPGSILTPFEQLCRHDRLHKPMLSVTFVKANRYSSKATAGRLTLGAIDQDSLDGDLTWINSTAQTFWGATFPPGALKLGDKDIWNPKEQNRRFIVDTGSSLLFMPNYTTEFANKMIKGSYYEPSSKRWLVPCRTGVEAYEKTLAPEERTPTFTFDVGGGHLMRIPPEDLVTFPGKPFDPKLTGGRQDMCLSSFQLGTERFAVLGNTFIKNAVIVFDYGDSSLQKRRIGFGNRKDVVMPRSHAR